MSVSTAVGVADRAKYVGVGAVCDARAGDGAPIVRANNSAQSGG